MEVKHRLHKCDENLVPDVLVAEDNNHALYFSHEKVWVWGIKFCPYCGIKLEEPENG